MSVYRAPVPGKRSQRIIAGRGRAGKSGPSAAAAQPESIECDLSKKLTLGQFLKLASLIDTGSEAKEAVASGGVTVNSDVDTRRGRGLVDGDVVAFAGRAARVTARKAQ